MSVESVGSGWSSATTTYADLVTSIINPSHRLSAYYPRAKAEAGGESRMHNYNDVMTVQELVDIVSFLQTEYELTPPPLHDYPPF